MLSVTPEPVLRPTWQVVVSKHRNVPGLTWAPMSTSAPMSTRAPVVPCWIVCRSVRSLPRLGGSWLRSRRPPGSSCRRPRQYRRLKRRFRLVPSPRRSSICDEFEGVIVWATVFPERFRGIRFRENGRPECASSAISCVGGGGL